MTCGCGPLHAVFPFMGYHAATDSLVSWAGWGGVKMARGLGAQHKPRLQHSHGTPEAVSHRHSCPQSTKQHHLHLAYVSLCITYAVWLCCAQVGNFRVEPPGLFRGRGEHPKMGKFKKRIYPTDITINIGLSPVTVCKSRQQCSAVASDTAEPGNYSPFSLCTTTCVAVTRFDP